MANFGDCSVIRQVKSIDLHDEKNNRAHRTNEISIQRLIVRRGQTFSITVNFIGSEFNPKPGDFFLSVETGPKPSQLSRTKILFPVTESINVKRWSAVVDSSNNADLCLTISSSPNAMIGSYNLFLCKKGSDPIVSYHLGAFVLLFNPWCSEDEVFLNSDEERKEYVMNEQGKIFIGNACDIGEIPWNFGQFEEDILDICIRLLDSSLKYQKNPVKDCKKRNSPVYICRVVSAMVNCLDDDGILCGKWNGPYSDGTYPGNWSGSVKILREWNESGCQPVLYGQCWVFAAVACTGIPTRVITNFDSAHDSNGNLTIDTCYNEQLDVDNSVDSVWNFHVWVEAWMARFDLRPGFEGWQAVDPTPQEKSEDIFCCGPAPVKAIKEANFEVNYDIPFIFSEVNAQQVKWLQLTEENKKIKLDVDSSSIGRCISTKSVGSDKREDITDNYKYAEGSVAERQITERALLSRRYLNLQKEIKLELLLDVNEPVYNGNKVRVHVTVANKSADDGMYDLKFCAKKKWYNGTYQRKNLKLENRQISVKAKEEKTTSFEVSYTDYGNFTNEYNLIHLAVLAKESKQGECAFRIKDIILTNPSLTFEVQEYPLLKQKLKVEVSFKNPLPVPLTDCIFTLEGAGLIEGEMELKAAKVNAGETAKVKAQITPHKIGEKKLSVNFCSDKVRNVKGSQIMNVLSHL